MLQIIKEESKLTGQNRATVTIEGDNPDEVMTADARNQVLTYAATLGVNRPGIGTGGGPYPVDPSGQATSPVEAANAQGRRYRYDWPVQGGL